MEIREHHDVKFPPTAITEAIETLNRNETADPPAEGEYRRHRAETYLEINDGKRQIWPDSIEEWLTDYRTEGLKSSIIKCEYSTRGFRIAYSDKWRAVDTSVSVHAPSRNEVEAMLEGLRQVADSIPRPEPEPDPEPTKIEPTIFIGHGRNPAWRDLKDHLVDQHGHNVEAYETGTRAGHHIRDILSSLTRRTTFAILVMTAEDEQDDGSMRARQNVVHETGLFQGALGFDRAIVLLENDVEAFSNLAGIQQIRFDNGRIRETFGDVLATIRREFGD